MEAIAKIVLGIMLYGFSGFVLVLAISLLTLGVAKIVKYLNKHFNNEHLQR